MNDLRGVRGSSFARRPVGRTGLEICTLGFGGAGIGNLFRPLSDEVAVGAARASYAAGVRYFDTAPYYGFGLSEQRIGVALRGVTEQPVISTKVGRRLVPTGPQDETVGREGYFSSRPFAPVYDYGYDSIMRSHTESLERLGVARVDILFCHDIGRLTHGAGHEVHLREFLEGGGYRAMRELRDSGAVRAIGVGVNEWEVCVELLDHCDFDCIMLAGRYTLLEQPSLEQLLPLCCARQVSIICAGPFNSGILAAGSKAAARSHYNYAPPPDHVLERVRGLEALCEKFDVPLAAATEAETHFLLALARDAPFIQGVVGWVDFESPEAPASIARLAQHSKLVGLRPMIQDIPEVGWMLRESLRPAFEAMIRHDLVFDALVKPPHLPALLELLRRYPALSVVVDHGAKPPIASGDLRTWQRDIGEIARSTGAVCKLSGLVTEAGSAAPQALAPCVQHLLATFGPARLLWGSDWPVCELVCSYEEWVATSDQLLAALSADERTLVFSETARKTYGL